MRCSPPGTRRMLNVLDDVSACALAARRQDPSRSSSFWSLREVPVARPADRHGLAARAALDHQLGSGSAANHPAMSGVRLGNDEVRGELASNGACWVKLMASTTPFHRRTVGTCPATTRLDSARYGAESPAEVALAPSLQSHTQVQCRPWLHRCWLPNMERLKANHSGLQQSKDLGDCSSERFFRRFLPDRLGGEWAP